jgi:sialic acid synthase SpsE
VGQPCIPCKFIAEVSSNHARDLARCLEFVDVTANIGCGAVKFQLFRIEELFAAEVRERKPELERRREWELPVEYLAPIAKRAHERGIEFCCTPFYLEAVDELFPHVDFYKVASYELLWHPLIAACAKTGKPLVLSTGMATIDEIGAAVKVARDSGCKHLTLLHCTSSYPTPPNEANLAAMGTMASAFGCPVGWSDHTVSPAVVSRAIHKWGATEVEFHLDLDGKGAEFAAGHCWLPHQMKTLLDDLATSFAADGDGKKEPVPAELPDRDWRADPSDGLRPFIFVRDRVKAGAPR